MNYKNAYKKAVDDLNPSPELINIIKTGKENRIVKFSKKRIAAVAAIACMTVGTTVFAASHITTYIMSGSPSTESVDYDDVRKFAEEEKLEVTIPEALSNGYSFNASNVDNMKGVDEAGNTIGEGEVLQVTYNKVDCPDLYLYVNPTLESEDYRNATEIKEINGIKVYYNKDTYKFVPSAYEKTNEDKQKEEAGHFFVSYGSKKVETQRTDSIVFEIGGKTYNMMSFDNEMNANEWFEMAEELIK